MEDRQVQHTGKSNATSAALAPNVACYKCLARESSPGLWFMVHGFVLGSVYDSVHGLVNGLVQAFVHDSWFILTY